MKLNAKKIVLFFSIINISLDIYSSNDEGKAPKAPKGFIILQPESYDYIEELNLTGITQKAPEEYKQFYNNDLKNLNNKSGNLTILEILKKIRKK